MRLFETLDNSLKRMVYVPQYVNKDYKDYLRTNLRNYRDYHNAICTHYGYDSPENWHELENGIISILDEGMSFGFDNWELQILVEDFIDVFNHKWLDAERSGLDDRGNRSTGSSGRRTQEL